MSELAGEARQGEKYLAHSDWAVLQQVWFIFGLSGFPELYLKLILQTAKDSSIRQESWCMSAKGTLTQGCNSCNTIAMKSRASTASYVERNSSTANL